MTIRLHTRTPSGKCPVCGQAGSTCTGDEPRPAPVVRAFEGSPAEPGAINAGLIYVPDHFSRGTLSGKSHSGIFAAERIVENGRQLYMKGAEISVADVERLGVTPDGHVTMPHERAARKKEHVIAPATAGAEEREDDHGADAEGSGPRRQVRGRRRAAGQQGRGHTKPA